MLAGSSRACPSAQQPSLLGCAEPPHAAQRAHAPLCFAAGADRHRSAPDRAVEEVPARCRPASPSRACSTCSGTCPNGVIDRRAEPTVAEAVPGSIATLKVRVLKHKAPPRGNTRAPYKVQTEDDTGRLDLIFFHAERKFIERQLPVGEERYVSGRVERYGDTLQMSHPDYIVAPGPARRAADAGAGLSAHRGPVGQDHAEGLTPGARSPARGPRVAGAAMAQGARLAGLRRGAAAAAPADRCSRRVARRAALATARLRRAARGPARARARAPELQGRGPAAASGATDASARRSPTRSPSR